MIQLVKTPTAAQDVTFEAYETQDQVYSTVGEKTTVAGYHPEKRGNFKRTQSAFLEKWQFNISY